MDSEELFGGFTAKQRLREEIESPFRKVRVFFFGASAASALLALYFSLISTGKALAGGWPDAPPLEDALTNVGVNVIALAVCAGITLNDLKAGEARLTRIKKGGELAKLTVAPAKALNANQRVSLAEYRRGSRVLICAGDAAYINELCRSLCADQRKDFNTLPAELEKCDVVVVPVLLEGDAKSKGMPRIGDAAACWRQTTPTESEAVSFDVSRADGVVAFPVGPMAWADYLDSEVGTAQSQGFDVLGKGLTITVKKNGRILRRATGQPQWDGLIGTMEVMDGSKFGMPGDSEKYGGP